MKSVSLLIILFLACTGGFSQNKLTDSLKHVVRLAKEDTTGVLAIAELGFLFRNSNSDSSVYYGQKALALARQIKFRRGEALALSNIGLALRFKGDLPEALKLEIEAVQIAEENNCIPELGMALRRIGTVYMDLGNYSAALPYYYRALDNAESVQSKRGIALDHLSIGIAYESMDQLDSALFHIQKSEAEKDYVDHSPDVNRIFGNIYAKKGNPQRALLYYKKGIQAGLMLNDFRTISSTYSDAAKMFRQLNQIDSSIAYAKKGVEYGQKVSYQKGILLSSTILSELYDAIDPKAALQYYKIAAAAKDSLFGAGNVQTVQTLISKEEARQKEIELAKAAFQNQLKQYSLATGLGIFFIIAFFLYRNNRQKQRTNKVLQSTLDHLKSAQAQLIQAEKMASLGELTAGIAHEIQNPLNFINNFSEVNKELVVEMNAEIDARNFDEVKAIAKNVSDNAEKINHHGKRADAIVKGMLQHSRTNSGQKELTDLNKLVDEYLRLAYHGLRARDKTFSAKFTTDFDPTLDKINVIPQEIGRVILNLINNAFYAVNEKKKKQTGNYYEPTVTVSTKNINSQGGDPHRPVRLNDPVGPGKIQISIKDNGDGIPEAVKEKIFQPFFTTKPPGQGTGLGLSLSYDIVTKGHGGELKVESSEGSGTELIITLPVSKDKL